MITRLQWRHVGFVPLLLAGSATAFAVPLAPHKAIYDLSLSSQTEDLVSVEGRIAMDLTMETCGRYDLDYRFVARFGQEGEQTLTDQRTRASEAADGASFEFETYTYVDGAEQNRIQGTAQTRDERTQVQMALPVERGFELPPAYFPLGHTAALIRKAMQGERIVQMNLFDGDDQGDKELTTTAILSPLGASQAAGFEGLRGWRVDESYFNADSDADGLPIFHTRYTLYENGVTDEIYMDFGEYALEGSLSELTLGAMPAGCR
ncbi:EipB family protein [Aureimonas populi]|uniref:EipB family protein n=1 Tax=Aureimonas populi TaxID=1701758 RepID=A0ABW5CNW1_9HYPH|nr:DUF1849 family protein [Aureimonas populi]